jgi:hypothetical protein
MNANRSQPAFAAKLFIFLLSFGVTATFIINLCSSAFGCGCRSWWAGAAQHCNIHTAGVKHCPWCSYGNAGFLCALALILAPQFAISFWPGTPAWKYRLLLSLAAFPVFGALVALVYGLISGYWRT